VRSMIPRLITDGLLEALEDRPVTLLVGARQTGKSTLALAVASQQHPSRYLTFDDAPALAAASGDPVGFLAGLQGDVVLDEIQLAPGLFRSLKATVDRDRRPGHALHEDLHAAHYAHFPGAGQVLAATG